MKQRRLSLILTVLAGLLMVILPVSASAAAPAGGNGLRVSPIRTSLTISPGSSQEVVIYVTNITNSPARLQVIVNDFTASPNESGTPDIILNPNEQAATHSLKQFVAAPPDFDLAPHQQTAVKVDISVPAGTAGGGYYGVVRFVGAGGPSGNQSVNVATSVGSLILLTVPGNIVENLALTSFTVADGGSAGSLFTSGNALSVTSRFTNNGNIQEIPDGKILLKKGSKTLATYNFNSGSEPGNVLPGSIRKFTQPLKKLGWGKYTVEGNFGYGTNGRLLSATKTFYIIPVWLIVAVIVLIILIILAIIFGQKELKRHDRRLLANYRRGGRPKRS